LIACVEKMFELLHSKWGGAYITILSEEVKVGMEFKKNVQLLLNETGVFQFNHYFRKKKGEEIFEYPFPINREEDFKYM